MGAEKKLSFLSFVRFGVGVAGNGDVAPPTWFGYLRKVAKRRFSRRCSCR
jgi:hypothetical protein